MSPLRVPQWIVPATQSQSIPTRTREHLGETGEALAGKASEVRARARDKASELAGRLQARAAKARQQAATAAGNVREQAGTAAASISGVTPEPVSQAACNAAATARRHRGPLVAALGAALASVLAWLLVKRWRRA